MTDAIARAFADTAFIGHQAAARLVGVDRKILRRDGDAGHVGFGLVGVRSRRYAEDDIRGYVAYLKARGAEKCRSRKAGPPKAATKGRKARTTSTISPSKVYDFLAQREERRSARQKPL